ncbi:MAG: hypothetical protein JOZ01_04130 [Candidatus Eremiobacteraeota bacterium]|nr:hypothetical protein [Candidatus Eremiobacteraeota bacterium]
MFADVRAAMPLGDLKAGACAKSASFGSSTYVRYHGAQSPDLSCVSGTLAQRLAADVEKATTELDVLPMRHPTGE